MCFILEIQGVDVVLREGKSSKIPNVQKTKDSTAEEVMDDTYLNKLLSLFINKLKVLVSDVHIRFEHSSSSMKAIGAHIDQIHLDTIKGDTFSSSSSFSSSCANKTFALHSLSI